MITYKKLLTEVRRLDFTGRGRFIPLLIKKFIDGIITYSKSNELSKRSCNETIKNSH